MILRDVVGLSRLSRVEAMVGGCVDGARGTTRRLMHAWSSQHMHLHFGDVKDRASR